MVSEKPRPLPELLALVGAVPDLPFVGEGVSEAFQEGRITAAEGAVLQRHAQRSPRDQKRELAGVRPRSVESVESMKAKLADVAAKLRTRHPQRPEERGES